MTGGAGPRRGEEPFKGLAAILAITAMVVVGALPLVPGTVSSAAAGAQAVTDGGTMTEFSWTAPPEMTGTFVAVIELEVLEPTRCSESVRGTGTFTDENPVVLWVRTDDGSGRGLNFAQWDRSFQAHVGDVVDTRHVMSVEHPNNAWGFTPHSGGSVEERLAITIAGFGLSPEFGADSALSIRFTCEDAFRIVSMGAGRRGRSYTDQTLEGGVGWRFKAPFQDTQSYAARDRLEARFDTAHVRFETAFFSAEQEEGRLTLHHPGGDEAWPLPPPEATDAIFDGGPGEYTVNLNWRAQGSHFHISGILIGVDPVDSLDEVLGPRHGGS